MAYHPQTLAYNSSLQRDEYAAIGLDPQLNPVYPMRYDGLEVKRPDLEQALSLP
jgi:hypothetical protein